MAQGLTQTAAARHAGYYDPPHDGTMLMNNKRVRAELAIRRAKYEKAAEMSRKKVMDGLQSAIDQAKLTADPMAQIAGWREIARMCGYYEPVKHKIDVSVNGQVVIQKLQSMSDQELLALAEGRGDIIEGEIIHDDIGVRREDVGIGHGSGSGGRGEGQVQQQIEEMHRWETDGGMRGCEHNDPADGLVGDGSGEPPE